MLSFHIGLWLQVNKKKLNHLVKSAGSAPNFTFVEGLFCILRKDRPVMSKRALLSVFRHGAGT